MSSKPVLVRKKVGDQHYSLVNRKGIVVGGAVKTGTHLDDYPWDWHIDDELLKAARLKGFTFRRTQGVCDTLKACVDQLATLVMTYNHELEGNK